MKRLMRWGCHTCEAACSETHRQHGLQSMPRLRVMLNEKESAPQLCHHCEDAPCETHEEYALSRPRGLREALLIVASFLMFFFCLITPDVFVPWLAGGAW